MEVSTKLNEQGCHIVTSHARTQYGYVKIWRDGKTQQLHRYIYEQNHGEIPNELVVMHSCDNRDCINIEHLSLGTQKDNIQDMIRKGRRSPKACNPKKDIIPNNLKIIRKEKGLTIAELSEQTGVSKGHISSMENGRYNGSINTWGTIASVLKVPLNDLI